MRVKSPSRRGDRGEGTEEAEEGGTGGGGWRWAVLMTSRRKGPTSGQKAR
jgi:hypothetical protein